MKNKAAIGLGCVVFGVGVLVLVGAERKNKLTSVTPQAMADALHQVIAADRAVYTRVIVERLHDEQKTVRCSENWQAEKCLPVPSQMLRMGSELVQQEGAEFHYVLRSLWPINKKNGPETPVEKAGLEYVLKNPGTNFYSEEVLGGRSYFTAVYPDTAVSPACVACHNSHKDSPKRDYKLNDVMGGLVLRVALEF